MAPAGWPHKPLDRAWYRV